MDFQDFIKNIREKISRNKVKEAIEDLYEFLKNSPKLDQIILTKARYVDIVEQIRNGIIPIEDATVTKNMIRAALIDIVREIESEYSKSPEVKKEADNSILKIKIKIPFPQWLNSLEGIKVKNVTYITIGFYVLNAIIALLQNTNFKTYLEFKYFIEVSLFIHLLFILYAIVNSANYRAYIIDSYSPSASEKIIRNKLNLTRKWVRPSNEKDWNKAWWNFKEGVNITLRQFSYGWLAVWISWFALYSIILIGKVIEVDLTTLKNITNNLGNAAFIGLYLVLTVSTRRFTIESGVITLIIIILFFSLVEFLTVNFKENSYQAETQLGFNIFSGIFACVSQMLFFGRLNSKFISVNSMVFVFIFIYAAIQPLYSLFDVVCLDFKFKYNVIGVHMENVIYFVLFLALILKSILFLVVTWVMRTGKLQYFITMEGSLNFGGDNDFGDFYSSIPTTMTKR